MVTEIQLFCPSIFKFTNDGRSRSHGVRGDHGDREIHANHEDHHNVQDDHNGRRMAQLQQFWQQLALAHEQHNEKPQVQKLYLFCKYG